MEVHPTDLELAAFIDGDVQGSTAVVAQHLDNCPLCRARAYSGGAPVDLLSEKWSIDESSSLPDFVRDVFASSGTPTASPGQLWRIESQSLAALVLLLDGDNGTFLVAPVTFDPEMADEYTLCIDADASQLNLPLAIWASARTAISSRLFDRLVGHLDAVPDVVQLHDAFRHGRRTSHLNVGLPILAESDRRWTYRQCLLETFATFSDQSTQPSIAEPSGDSLLSDVLQRVRAELATIEDLEVIDDPFGDAIAAPLVPMCLARYWDATTRMCLLPDLQSFESIDSQHLTELVDLTALLRDCDFVTLVIGSTELDAVVYASPDLHPAYLVPEGYRSTPRWIPTMPLPLADAMRWWIQRIGCDDEPLLLDELAIESLPLEEFAARLAGLAVSRIKKSSTKNPFRIAALRTISSIEEEGLRDLILTGFRSGPSDLQDQLSKMSESVA